MSKILMALIWLFAGVLFASDSVKGFNHSLHEKNAFKNLKIECSACHNFSINADGLHASASPEIKESNFKSEMKSLCHQCHQSQNSKFRVTPKTCVLCHTESDSLKKIKPLNHQTSSWKKTHALNARVESTSCMNCHIQSQCVKCHVNRNDIAMKNHNRNFRFTHSIEARGQPQRCDACHSQSFCIKCHLGK